MELAQVLFSLLFIYFTTRIGVSLLYDFINMNSKFDFEAFVGIVVDLYINSGLAIAILLKPFLWKYMIFISPIANILIIIILVIIYKKEFHK